MRKNMKTIWMLCMWLNLKNEMYLEIHIEKEHKEALNVLHVIESEKRLMRIIFYLSMSVRRPVLLPILSVRGFVVTPSTVKFFRDLILVCFLRIFCKPFEVSHDFLVLQETFVVTISPSVVSASKKSSSSHSPPLSSPQQSLWSRVSPTFLVCFMRGLGSLCPSLDLSCS